MTKDIAKERNVLLCATSTLPLPIIGKADMDKFLSIIV